MARRLRVGVSLLTTLAACSGGPTSEGGLPPGEPTGGAGTDGEEEPADETGDEQDAGSTGDDQDPDRVPGADVECVPLEALDVVWNSETSLPRVVRGDDLRHVAEDCDSATFADPPDAAGVARQVLDQLASIYRLSADDDFDLGEDERHRDPLGFAHVRASHTFDGVPVYGSQLSVHIDSLGRVSEVSGRLHPVDDVDTAPALAPDTALERARDDLAADVSLVGFEASEPRLVIAPHSSGPRLAYELTLRRRDGARWYLVDAQDGTIVQRRNPNPTAAPFLLEDVATAPALVTGTRLATEGGGSIDVDVRRDDAADRTYLGDWVESFWWVRDDPTLEIFEAEPVFQAGDAWGSSDPLALSAAANVGGAVDYFCTVHQWCGATNDPDGPFFNTVDVLLYRDGENPDEEIAAYDPWWHTIHVGTVPGLGSFATTDVMAHELTHGIIEETGRLRYQSESGALNESFADIFGALAEFAQQPDGTAGYPAWTAGQADWLLAEDSGTLFRDMRNPGSSLAYGLPSPSRYGGTHWLDTDPEAFDYGGIHYNSGVQNFFFYLLAEGGIGTNDGLPYAVEGLGREVAGRIAFRTLVVYTAWDNDHVDVREAWLSAARDISLADDVDYLDAVIDAWDAVGVGGDFCPTWYPDLDGDEFGDDETSLVSCDYQPGHVSEGGDCDDANANSFPGAGEVCGDGSVNDCEIEFCEENYDAVPGCVSFADVCGEGSIGVVDGEVLWSWASDCPIQESTDLLHWQDYEGPVDADGCSNSIDALEADGQFFRVRTPPWSCHDEDLGDAVGITIERMPIPKERGLTTACHPWADSSYRWPQYAMRWTAPHDGTFRFEADQGAGVGFGDAVDLHIRGGDCHGQTIACEHDWDILVSTVEIEAYAGREYTVVMTAQSAMLEGHYALTITEP